MIASRITSIVVVTPSGVEECRALDGHQDLGYNQEALDAECAALARALKPAARRQTAPESVTIFTDAQAAIRRMATEEPSPRQKFAIQAGR